MKPETKPFYKTSEFWMMAFAQLGTLVTAISGLIPTSYALVIGAVLTCGYNISRGLSKSGSEYKPQ